MNPTFCLLVSRFVENPFFLLAVALLFVEKIHQSAPLFWFGLRIVGFLSNILLTSRNPKNNGWFSRIFWITVQRKRSQFVAIQPVIPTRRMIRGIFVRRGSELELFSNIQDQN
jgi:hypothetical protein